MRLIKKFILASLIIVAKSGYAVQVLPAPPPNPAGQAAGKAVGGLLQGLAAGIAQRKRAREQEKKENEQAEQIAREKALLDELLKDYSPSKNSEYVLKILQSELSNETKIWVTSILNEQHKLHLEEQKKKGVLSWFSK